MSTSQRILLVEDEFLIAMDLRLMIEDAGHSVLGPVGTIEEALAAVEAGPPAVALLDMNLHGEKVTPVADMLATRGVPFAFLTGYGTPDVLPGHHDRPVVAKPFTREAVLALVAALLDER